MTTRTATTAPCDAKPASPVEGRDRVATIEHRLHEATAAWSSLFRSSELGAIAQIVVAAAPSLCVDDQTALAKLGVWICAIDDVVDDLDEDVEEVSLRIDHYIELVTTGDCAELRFDPVAALLVDVMAALTSRPIGRSLWSVFATQTVDALEAMRWEREVQACRCGFSVDEYLRRAAESVFAKPVATAAAMLLEDAAVVEHVSSFLAAQRHMACIVRLVNDRATRRRETEEGCINVYQATSDVDVDALVTIETAQLENALARMPASPAAQFIRVFVRAMTQNYATGQLR